MGMKAEDSDYQKQFEAAVHVIQGLPKDGSYHPSYEEKLRFYGYYKQATVGQCGISRPGFWDPIGRYKWDAWNGLGKMTKQEAMAAYITEMKKAARKVMDTVPMEEWSEDRFASFKPLYEVIHDMPRPPESFFKTKEVKQNSEPSVLPSGLRNGPAEDLLHLPMSETCKQADLGHTDEALQSSQLISDLESEVFCDSLEQVEPDQARMLSAQGSFSMKNPHRCQGGQKSGQVPFAATEGEPSHQDLQAPPGNNSPQVTSESQASTSIRKEVDLQMANTIRALQEDMKTVMERLQRLESLAAVQGHILKSEPCQPIAAQDEKELPNWPTGLSHYTFFFLLAWPFIVQGLIWRFQSRKR